MAKGSGGTRGASGGGGRSSGGGGFKWNEGGTSFFINGINKETEKALHVISILENEHFSIYSEYFQKQIKRLRAL